jgi:MFS family permease
MAAPPPTAPADDTSPPASLSAQLKDLDSRFWIVNTMEMFERLAYYGVRTVVPLYMVLAREEGGPELSHEQKGVIFAWWAGMQSVLPMFTGGYADRYGHKQTIAAAIVLKIIGYLMMAELKTYEGFFAGCMLLAAGTAIFKPGVQGTLAATLKKSSASVGWGVFYQLVNVGGFIGPVLAGRAAPDGLALRLLVLRGHRGDQLLVAAVLPRLHPRRRPRPQPAERAGRAHHVGDRPVPPPGVLLLRGVLGLLADVQPGL